MFIAKHGDSLPNPDRFNFALFYGGCAVSWCILLPLLLVGGGLVLLADAAVAELRQLLRPRAEESPETPSARELAQRLCSID